MNLTGIKWRLMLVEELIVLVTLLVFVQNISSGEINAGWKIYRSSTMGFLIEHPRDWKVTSERRENGGRRVNLESLGDVLLSVIQGASLYSKEKDRNLTFEEIVGAEKIISQNQIEPKEKKILLDGYPALAISYTQYFARMNQHVKSINIFEKEHHVWIYVLIYQYDETKDAMYQPILSQMLSTFKFEK